MPPVALVVVLLPPALAVGVWVWRVENPRLQPAAEYDLPGAIAVRKQEGAAEHVVFVTNQSGEVLHECDVAVTVRYHGGGQRRLTRSWPTWRGTGSEPFRIPTDGWIERVDVTGTVSDPVHGKRRRVTASVGWEAARAVMRGLERPLGRW